MYRPYESYNQPGVDWLDAIPSHWGVRRTKNMFSLQKSKVGRAASLHTLLSLTLGGVVPRDISEGGKFPAEFDTYQIVEPDDLVFCLFDIDETPRTIGIARDDGMITGAYSVYRAIGPCVPEYACYYFLHVDSFKGLRPFYTGLRKVVRADTFSKVEMPVPPLKEQTQIAKFLDYETAKIDALIEKQQQLIALLKEKRQAVISHAVTEGLNPDAPMRDSGVEWLGDVPAHWEVAPLKHHTCRFEQGWSPQCDQREADQGEWGVLKVGCVNGGIFDRHENKCLPEALLPRKEYLITKGDLLISRANTRDLVGSAAVVSEATPNLLLCDKLYRLRLDGMTVVQFVSHYLGTSPVRQQIELGATGASHSMQNIGQTTIRNLPVPNPPTREAQEIVAALERRLTILDSTIVKGYAQIALLQERRTALISAAVTGKIDVRGWQAPESEAEVA